MTTLRKLLEDKTFRESMGRFFFFPKRKLSAVLRTKPNTQAHVDFGAVGTAFDYCLRLALIRTHNLDRDELKSFPGLSHYLTRYQTDRNVSRKMEPHLRVLNDYLSFNQSDAASLFRAILFLAKFDSEYRSGLPILNFAVKLQDVEELARVVANSNLKWTTAKVVVIGPVFDRSGSKLAIHADADLIVGTTLVEVKTSSRMELKEDIRQLLGYYALNKLAGTPRIIDRLGVYYPRFDFFLEFPIRELLSESQEYGLISIFRSELGDNIQSHPVRSLPQFFSSAVAGAFVTDDVGNTLLHYAVNDRDRAEAARLLKMGAEINAKNNAGRAPLHLAVVIKDTQMVILLRDAGANVDTPENSAGYTPLHLAVCSKDMQTAKLLLDAGANVNALDRTQSTPLLWAVSYKQEILTEMLLNAGADVNCQDDEGWTPLHQAVMDRQKNLVDMLIKHGAKADTIDKDGVTPLSIASTQRNGQIYSRLRETSKNNVAT